MTNLVLKQHSSFFTCRIWILFISLSRELEIVSGHSNFSDAIDNKFGDNDIIPVSMSADIDRRGRVSLNQIQLYHHSSIAREA